MIGFSHFVLLALVDAIEKENISGYLANYYLEHKCKPIDSSLLSPMTTVACSNIKDNHSGGQNIFQNYSNSGNHNQRRIHFNHLTMLSSAVLSMLSLTV